MTKKSLLAFAVLASACGAAMATQVTVYGLVDEGIYVKDSTGDKHTTTLESGIAGASRWGLTGTEDLANGYKVKFILEGKLNADDGTMGTAGKLFDRAAIIEIVSPSGSLQFGRHGMLRGGVGGGIFAGQTNPFGVVYKEAGALNVFQNAATRIDNQVRYQSPNFAGFTGYAQYSFATGLDTAKANDDVSSSKRDRYAAVGATYRNGGLRAALVYDRYFFNDIAGDKAGWDDAQNIALAANYKFGAFKVFGGYQHAMDARVNIMGKNIQRGDADIFMLGGSWDVWGGTAMLSLAYATGDANYTNDSGKKIDRDLDAWQVGLGYKYPLSKRTMLYAAAAYRSADLDAKQDGIKASIDGKTKTKMVAFGIQHKF